jgi:thioredoxin
MKRIVELNETNFEGEALKAAEPVLVDFHAPWCGPCKVLGPWLEHLAAQLGGRVKFARVNVDDVPELAARYQITGVPTLILFRGGQAVDQVVGLLAPRALSAWLERAVREPALS